MATKSILYCDSCDKPQSDVGPILPTYFLKEGQEMCLKCAVAELHKLYGKEMAKDLAPESVSPETKALDDQRQLLFREHGVPIYVVTPKQSVKRSQVIKYGKPGNEKEVEILAEVQGKPGEYFAKLAG